MPAGGPVLTVHAESNPGNRINTGCFLLLDRGLQHIDPQDIVVTQLLEEPGIGSFG